MPFSVCLQRSQRPTDPEEVTNESLRSMCDNTLHLLTTTVGRLADVCTLSTSLIWSILCIYINMCCSGNGVSSRCFLCLYFMLCMCEASLTSSVGQLNLICTTSQLKVLRLRTLLWYLTCVFSCLKVLWPKLLFYLTPSQYSNATTPLCKSLIVLGSKKKNNQEPSFKIDFTREGTWL